MCCFRYSHSHSHECRNIDRVADALSSYVVIRHLGVTRIPPELAKVELTFGCVPFTNVFFVLRSFWSAATVRHRITIVNAEC